MSKKKKNITLDDLIVNADKISQANKEKKTIDLKVRGYEGVFTFQIPDAALVNDAAEIEDAHESNRYMVYTACIDPNLKDTKLHDAYKIDIGEEIVDELFDEGQVQKISQAIFNESNFGDNAVKVIKN